MAVKMTGAEWLAFYSDPSFWPKGAWHDDEEFLVDGSPASDGLDLAKVPPEASITVSGGIVYIRATDNHGPSLESYIRRWRKVQTTTMIAVEVPKEKLEAVKAAIAAAGGKVQA